MNASKARDFFSAYYEGELSGGIKEAFERSLASDAALKLEYDEFCATMRILEEPEADVEVPADLHDKIMARLDLNAWENKQSEKASFWSRWRLAAIGGVAVLAIGATALNVSNRPSRENSTASTIPMPGNKAVAESIDFTSVDGELRVKITAAHGKYSLRRISDNSELSELVITGKEAKNSNSWPVLNDGQNAQAFAVYTLRNENKLTIVLPGKAQGTELKGSGTVMDLALAMADIFRTPLIVRANDLAQPATWDFAENDDVAARSSKLADQKLTLTVRGDGISVLNSFATR